MDWDRRVRRDNPLRAVREQVDFTWVRDEVAPCYGYNGNESVDPVVILKLLFLLFFDSVKSERERMRVIPERLDYLWFLGFGLDDEIPDHSVLSKARTRWGREIFERLFVRTVGQAVRAGLVDGSKIHVDSSLVDADAARESILQVDSPELLKALRGAYAAEERKLASIKSGFYKEALHKHTLSLTDPDATLVAHRRGGVNGHARLRYKNYRVVDDRCGVITAITTTTGSEHEARPLVALADQYAANTGMEVRTVVADQQDGTVSNFRTLQGRGINTHMGTLRPRGQAEAMGIFGTAEFVYERSIDTYRCPAGKTLTKRGYNKQENGWTYRARREVCRDCHLRDRCFHSANPNYTRMIVRYVGHEAVERGWAQSASRAARRDRLRRMTLIEGSFGQAAQNHHFKRARWRRLWRQQI